MRVTTVANKNPKATSPVLAFIDGKPAWFPQGTVGLAPGMELDVMVTGVLHPMDAAGVMKDFNQVKAFFIRPVDPMLDIEVQYDGFECSGSMCSTLSSARCVGSRDVITITPGAVGVYEADNVNVGWKMAGMQEVKKEPLHGGKGWVQSIQGKNLKRLVGVDDISQLNIYVRRAMFNSVKG
jgi:hypothetical protein